MNIIIEIQFGSFLKRGSTRQVDFVFLSLTRSIMARLRTSWAWRVIYLDAIVLGRRLPRGSRVTVRVFGAVELTDHGMYDDKFICSHNQVGWRQRFQVMLFFSIYAKYKWLLNLIRRRGGRNTSEGWVDAKAAIGRARP